MDDNDVSLPRATLTKIVKDHLPAEMRCASDAMDMLMECCTEFIQLLSSESNELATKDHKSTITPEHVMRALQQLGFDEWAAEVKASHEEFKEEAKKAPKFSSRKTKADLEGLTDEQQIELQRRMFAEARARSMNMDAQAEANVQAALVQQQQVAAALTAAHAQTAAAAADDTEDYDD